MRTAAYADKSGQTTHPGAPAGSALRLYLGVFAVFVILYGLTAQRGVAWQDSGIFQWRIWKLDPVGVGGLALSHPLLIVLGKAFGLIPLGPLAWRMNFLSSVCGALTVANVALLVRRLAPQQRIAAWMAAGVFGLAHTVWWLATICESQMLLAVLFTTELHVLVSLVRRPKTHLVLLLGLLNGLGLATHNLALLAAPAYVLMSLYLCRRDRLPWRSIIYLSAGWLIGASGLLVIVAHQAIHDGLLPAVHSALFGQRWQGAVLGGEARTVARGAGYVLYNFPNLALPLMVAGLWSFRRRLPGALAWALGYLSCIYLLFAIRYRVPDQFMFFVPFYAMVAILAGLGLAGVGAVRGRWLRPLALASIVLTPCLYAAAPVVWRACNLPLPGRKDLPYRDPGRYWLSPWKAGEDSAERFARDALDQVASGGTIIADSTSIYPLLLTRSIEHRGQGVKLLSIGEAGPQNIAVGRPKLYLVSDRPGYYPQWLARHATFRKDTDRDVLFRVLWREAM